MSELLGQMSVNVGMFWLTKS